MRKEFDSPTPLHFCNSVYNIIVMKLALLILSIFVFLLAAFGVVISAHVALLPLGLAFFAGSFLPWKW